MSALPTLGDYPALLRCLAYEYESSEGGSDAEAPNSGMLLPFWMPTHLAARLEIYLARNDSTRYAGDGKADKALLDASLEVYHEHGLGARQS